MKLTKEQSQDIKDQQSQQNITKRVTAPELEKITGYGIILNTSFNENEPIVDTPEQAIDCFLRTDMDILFLEKFMICKDS